MLWLLLLFEVELGRGVEAMALTRRAPRVGELGRIWVRHVVEVQSAAEALLGVDGHGGHLRARDFLRVEEVGKRCSSTGAALNSAPRNRPHRAATRKTG